MAGAFGAAQLGGVVDPRLDNIDADNIGTHHDNIIHEVGPPDSHGHSTIYLDSSITFETYNWWARRAREHERSIKADAGFATLWQVMFGGANKDQHVVNTTDAATNPDEKHDYSDDGRRGHSDEKRDPADPTSDAITATPSADQRVGTDKYGVSGAEWETAQRAARTASWGAIFYLITTDILGPFSAPWAFAQLGYGPGVAIFVVFGGLGYYSAMQLWRMFIGLDSPRYPMRNYGDLAFRLFGNWARVTANFLQSFQFFLNVAICIVVNGQGLVQMVAGANGKGYICFVLAEVIFTLCGFVLGQIRTLQRLGWLANLSVWLNVVVIVATMVAVFQYSPNYPANAALGIKQGPIQTSAGLPPDKTLSNNVLGVMNGVFAYGGATMFNELMAEMRRPWDFWKAVLIADIFITTVYMVFGLVVYSQQGQFTFNPTYQGISSAGYSLQTLGNAISFTVSVIAALLYGNIGIKVFYASVMRDVFKFPPLETKKGKWTWAIFVPIYWALAFVLGGAVPQISQLTAFEGAATIMQFSYVFPPLFMVAYNCQKDSALPEESYDPRTGQTQRVDTGPRRWWRGFKKQLLLNTFDSLYFLAAAATAVLGLWASIVGMIAQYDGVNVKSYSCHVTA